jgi:hypothetical protein
MEQTLIDNILTRGTITSFEFRNGFTGINKLLFTNMSIGQ